MTDRRCALDDLSRTEALLERLEKVLEALLLQRAEEEETRRRRSRARRRYPEAVRIALLDKQFHRCAICMGPMGYYDSHVDHIVPRSAGGDDGMQNLQLTHMSCNLRKSNKQADTDQERMPWA